MNLKPYFRYTKDLGMEVPTSQKKKKRKQNKNKSKDKSSGNKAMTKKVAMMK